VLLNKLESGFLLFQTQQGLVAVEPSFWERVYLLWTFRNFRQLSLPLLNLRQTALINNLFLEHAAVAWHKYEPSLEIGVVQDFVPPAPEMGSALAIDAGLTISAARAAEVDASPAMEANLPEQTAGQYVAPPIVPIAVEPAMMADVPPAVEKEETENEGIGMDRAEFVPGKALDRSFAPSISWPIVSWSWPIISWLRPRSSNPGTANFAASDLAATGPAASRPRASGVVISGFAAAIGALSLCVYFIVAFHRIGGAPASPAHSSPPQLSSPDSPSAPEPTSVDENPTPVPDGPRQAGDGPDAVPDAAVEPTPAEVPSSTTTTHRAMTPEPASRGATARVASRSSGGSHAAAFSKVPASTSTHRMTLAPASRGAMPRSAQSYFDLANQQMHKGKYAAAAADYKRAWRIEENSAAAKGRMVRARRAMQAEKQGIANRR
jgi:hypothetical protein